MVTAGTLDRNNWRLGSTLRSDVQIKWSPDIRDGMTHSTGNISEFGCGKKPGKISGRFI